MMWIEPRLRDEAVAARYTVVDASTVFMTHLTEVLRRESATLMTRAETERLLDRVRKTQPSLVEELVPTVLAVSDVQRVLQGLLREKVSIRHLDAILETLADVGRQTKETGILVDRVRQRLGAAICQSLVGEQNALQVLTLDPLIESRLLHGLRGADNPATIGIDAQTAEQLLSRLVQMAEKMMKSNLLPVLLCAPELRRHLRMLSERVLPHLRVLAMTEIPHTIELRSFGVVNLPAPAPHGAAASPA